MGLDISVYSGLTPAKNVETTEDGEPVNFDRVVWIRQPVLDWTEKHFPGRAAGLTAGYYNSGDSFGFRAGSYSGYGEWRDMLAKYAGYPSAVAVHRGEVTVGPFIGLIDFADNEGYIGPIVSRTLASDFIENETAIRDKNPPDWFMEVYRKFRKAFEMAAENGVVEFH